MQIAERLYSLAQEQNASALLIKAHMAFAATLYFMGDFESAQRYAILGALRRCTVSGPRRRPAVIGCLCHEALSKWHLGEIASSHATMAEAISIAKELKDLHALAVALNFSVTVSVIPRKYNAWQRISSNYQRVIISPIIRRLDPFCAVGQGAFRAMQWKASLGSRTE